MYFERYSLGQEEFTAPGIGRVSHRVVADVIERDRSDLYIGKDLEQRLAEASDDHVNYESYQ